MRELFTDHYNSLFHFIFGFLSYKFLGIMPLFLIYQSFEYLYFNYLQKNDKNFRIDLFEFFIGYFIASILFNITIYIKRS